MDDSGDLDADERESLRALALVRSPLAAPLAAARLTERSTGSI